MEAADTLRPSETILWSATVDGHYVRLIVAGSGSAWRCDCTQPAQSRDNSPAACEHVQRAFDVWFGRNAPDSAVITNIVDAARSRNSSSASRAYKSAANWKR